MSGAGLPTLPQTIRRNGIFFVTDAGFALPTIAGAIALRRKTAPERADVRIVVTDLEADIVARLRDVLHQLGIMVDTLPREMFSDFSHQFFNKTHVPMATLGRFFMLDCVKETYDRILYLDGDTWPAGDPASLLEAELPLGCLAAAEDQSYFYRHDRGKTGRSVRAYFAGIGIDGDAGYFNAGVLLADAATWRTLSAEAFGFFREHPQRCKYHDQSALNAVAGRRRVRLGPRWNYLSMYGDWGVEPKLAPEILHFCGGRKPWMVPEDGFFTIYERAFAALPALGLPVRRYAGEELRAARNAARWQSLKLNSIFLPRKLRRRSMYRRLARDARIS